MNFALFRAKIAQFTSNKRRFLVVGSVLLAFILLFGGITLYSFANQSKNVEGEFISVLGDESITEAPLPLPSGELKTLGILLLGYGGAGHDGGYLTDAIQVLQIDFDKKVIALISIPRDLWVTTNNGSMKINAVVTGHSNNKTELIKSGAPALKKVVTDMTGIPINYFVGIDFVGLERTVGQELKTINVEVSETLDDPWYPIKGEELNTCNMTPEEIADVHAKYSGFELERQFTCRYKHLLYEKGTVKMEGGDALAYMRSRHGSAAGDISRGKRQQEVLTAIGKKLFSLDILRDVPKYFTIFGKHIQTDVDLGIAQHIAPFLHTAKDFKIITINISPGNVLTDGKASSGAFILIPKEGTNQWGQTKEYIQEQLK